MHLADAFIQSDLHCIQDTVFTFDQLLLSLGIEPMILALLAPCSTIWATGKQDKHFQLWEMNVNLTSPFHESPTSYSEIPWSLFEFFTHNWQLSFYFPVAA